MQRVATHTTAGSLQSLDKHGKDEATFTVEQLIKKAIRLRAQSIHIEPQATSVAIRYRVDGVMKPASSLSKHLLQPIVSTIKKQAGVDVRSKKPQSGSFSTTSAKQTYTIELTCVPSPVGERVVLRLAPAVVAHELTTIGYYGANLSELGRLAASPRGLLVIAGDYNSGTPKTLLALSQLLDHPSIAIAHVHHDNQDTAAIALETKVRLAVQQQPHIISLSSITSAEVLSAALEAAQHHLVIATVPAASSSAVYMRLIHWSKDRFELARLLIGVIFQEAHPVLCPDCRKPYTFTKTETATLKAHHAKLTQLAQSFCSESGLKIPSSWHAYTRNSEGCRSCNNTGSTGELATIQVNHTTPKVQKMLIEPEPLFASLDIFLAKEAVVAQQSDMLVKALCGQLAWQKLAA